MINLFREGIHVSFKALSWWIFPKNITRLEKKKKKKQGYQAKNTLSEKVPSTVSKMGLIKNFPSHYGLQFLMILLVDSEVLIKLRGFACGYAIHTAACK